jgi:hypothetical protein
MFTALAAICALAFGLRFWGISFGLPELFHPDEPAYVLQALAVGRGVPDGLTFANPPLFKYLLVVEYAATFALQRVVGLTSSPTAFVEEFRAHPSTLYVLARLTSAVLGTLTVGAVGALGYALNGRRAGLLAAGVYAVAFLPVREAHFGTNDTALTLLVTLGLLACARVARGGTLRTYLVAGALVGLAFSTKYDGIALLAPFFVAHFARPKRWSKDLLIAGAACIGAAVLSFPSLVTEPGRVLNDVYVHLWVEARGGYDGLDPAGGYVFYARTLVTGLGVPLLLGSLGGIALAARRRERASLVVLSLPMAMLAVLGSQQLYFARFALPTLPALVVLAAVAIGEVWRRRWLVGVVALVLVIAPTVADAIRFDGLLGQTDTRTLAREWIQTQLPADARIAIDAPPLGPSLSPEQTQHEVSIGDAGALFDLSVDDYRQRGADYVVTSSFTLEARAVDPEREAKREAFDGELGQSASIVAEFRPYWGEVEPPFTYDQIYGPWTSLDLLQRPGPTIVVYRLNR